MKYILTKYLSLVPKLLFGNGKYFIVLAFLLPSFSHAQPVRIVAEEWNIYNDSLGGFDKKGEQLVVVEFDREKKQIRMSHGEYITRTYAVHSIEEKLVDGQVALYWNLYDSDYARVAFIPEMIMFIAHDGTNAMVLTKLTFLESDDLPKKPDTDTPGSKLNSGSP
jgi:hypothetical protein